MAMLEALMYYVMYYISGFVSSIVMIIIGCFSISFEYISNHMQVSESDFLEELIAFTDSNTALAVFLSNAVIVLIYWIAFQLRSDSLSNYAGIRKTKFINVFGSVAAGLFAYLAVENLMSIIRIPEDIMQEYIEHVQWLSDSNIWLMALVSVVAAPVVEELVFRGVLMKALQKAITPIGAVLVTSVLFTFAHGDIVQGMYSFAIGILLGYVKIKSGSLWNCIAMHFAFNMANVIVAATEFPVYVIPVWIVLILLVSALYLAGKRKNKHKKYNG